MIVSFHPLFQTQENRLCAGREPDADDQAAIARAKAVILPQGVRAPLYRMASRHCTHVFPHYDARFDYPGKTGQARLFERFSAPTPKTAVFFRVKALRDQMDAGLPIVAPPFVLKLDWGGEGETVFLIDTPAMISGMLTMLERCEQQGQYGFLIQSYVPHAGRTLRVVILYRELTAYWRVSKQGVFGSGLRKGAAIDDASDPDRMARATLQVSEFCRKTGINLAGFDLFFDEADPDAGPLFLEINYFFGRKGFGGSIAYYHALFRAVTQWVDDLPFAVNHRPVLV